MSAFGSPSPPEGMHRVAWNIDGNGEKPAGQGLGRQFLFVQSLRRGGHKDGFHILAAESRHGRLGHRQRNFLIQAPVRQHPDQLAAAVQSSPIGAFNVHELPDESADLVLNVRSMMEMTPEVIGFYFSQIQRTVPDGGLFACINRNQKLTNSKNYPYDDRWRTIVSQTSILQDHIHELIVERTETSQVFPVKETLKGLMPFT